MVRAQLVPKKPAGQQKFVIDCTKPVEDNILDVAGLEKYFRDRLKVEGKLNNFGSRVTCAQRGTKLVVTAEMPFSKRYLKYLTRKYLKRQMVRDFLRVIATNKTTYELRYFNVAGGALDEQE